MMMSIVWEWVQCCTCVEEGKREMRCVLYVQVDAMTYYDQEVKAVILASDAERVRALEKGLGTSFVTFSSPNGASE